MSDVPTWILDNNFAILFLTEYYYVYVIKAYKGHKRVIKCHKILSWPSNRHLGQVKIEI